MKKYIVFILLLISFASYGQFSNYTNINGRYKWIAGKFDSTFTLPSGTTPSLRTGGGTGSGALFYSTTDSTVYQYTGSQWTRLRGTDTAHVVSAYVRNTTGSILTPGQVVYINGSTGTTPTVALANNKQDSTSAMTFGFVRGYIAVNGFGFITTFGPLEGINTNAYTEGEVIYLDSIPGQFTHDKPQAPYHMVTLGYIIKKSGGNGTIYAKIQNGYELEELHNVRITAPVLNKSVIIYDSVKGLWVDTTVSAAGLGLGGSGTTNYLSKWTSSTALGNSLVFDNGTSVGVNTASPNASYKLDVNGAFRINDGGTVPFVLNQSSTAEQKISFRYANSEYGYFSVNTASGIVSLGSASYPVTYNGSTHTYNGNIRLNSTSASGNTPNVQFTLSGTSYGNIYVNWDSPSLNIESASNSSYSMRFSSGGSERMRLTGNGRLLIGTTTDGGQRVQIVGAGADQNSTALYIVNSNATRSAAFRDDGSLELTSLRFYGGTGQVTNLSVDMYFTAYIGRENLRLGQYGGVTINEGGIGEVDFRIEGDNNANLFFTDASVDNIGMGTGTPNSSALLHMSSTTKGFLPPVMTGAQAEAIGTPAEGLLVYANNGNGTTITSTGWWGYNGTTWVKLN